MQVDGQRSVSVIINEQKSLYGLSYITAIYSYTKFTWVQLDGMWYELHMTHDHYERWLGYMQLFMPVRVSGNQIEAITEKHAKYNKIIKIWMRSKNLHDMLFNVIENDIIYVDFNKINRLWVCYNKVGDVFHGTSIDVGGDLFKIDEKPKVESSVDIEIKEKSAVHTETNFITALMVTNSIPNTVSQKFIIVVQTFFEMYPSAIFECTATDFQINNLCSWISLLKDNINRDDYNKLIRKLLGAALEIREGPNHGTGVYACNMVIKRLCDLM